ncbi:MAG: hypothetical protein P9M14_07970 [Candidatus Alcyoniella australis]|nr:hypothetical protein [Candidatus Alcyoniella australis]
MEFKGKFEDLHPVRLLYSLFKANKSGLLIAEHNNRELAVPIKDGMPAFDPLAYMDQFEVARVLIDLGKLSAQDANLKRSWAASRKMSLREALIDSSLTTADEWERAARESFDRNIEEIFSFTHGKYRFRELEINAVPNKNRFPELIYRGVQNYSTTFIQRRLARRWSKPLMLNRRSIFSMDLLPVSDTDRPILQMVNRGMSPEQIVESTKISFSQTLHLLFTALSLEIIKFRVSDEERTSKKSKKVSRRKSKGTYGYVSPALERALHDAQSSVERIHEEAHLAAQLGSIEYESAAAAKPEKSAPAPEPDLDEEPLFEVDVEQQPEEPVAQVEPDEESLEEAQIEPDVDEAPALEEPAQGAEDPFSFLEEEQDTLLDQVEEEVQEAPADLEFTQEDTPEDIFAIGMSYLDQESYDYAHIALQEAVDRGLKTAESYAQLGWAIYRSAEGEEAFAQATELMRQGIAVDTSNFLPYLILGRIYKNEGDVPMAELYFIKSLELNRDCAEAREAVRAQHQT